MTNGLDLANDGNLDRVKTIFTESSNCNDWGADCRIVLMLTELNLMFNRSLLRSNLVYAQLN